MTGKEQWREGRGDLKVECPSRPLIRFLCCQYPLSVISTLNTLTPEPPKICFYSAPPRLRMAKIPHYRIHSSLWIASLSSEHPRDGIITTLS